MRVAGPDQAEAMARLHAQAFDAPWDAEALRALLETPGAFAFAAAEGFMLIRVAADEAEVLTLAVAPAARRQGLGRRLLVAAGDQAAAWGARTFFLEVAADNHPALALYRAEGFAAAGRRVGYYRRPTGPAADALVLKKPLTGAAEPGFGRPAD